jgi:hypothetical protein
MVPVRSWNFLSGIQHTQCGDPRAHRQEVFLHCANAYREASFWGNSALHSVSVDQQVAASRFRIWDVTEGWMALVGGAEIGPVVEDALPA